jgi:glycosyltransferase involved in cell wall biosynthesis
MIISITLDQQVGGIAQSLINYSKALKKINKTHLVILPDKAVIIKDLEDISNVKLVKIPKILLKFHLITKFVFDKNLENLLISSKFIFIHNYKLVKYLSNFRNKIGLINHSGKARKPHNNIYNIFLTSAAKERFLTKYPLSRTKNIIIPHGFSNIRQRKKIIDRNDNFLNVVAAGRFVEKKGFEDLIEVANILKKENINIKIKLYGEGPLDKVFKKKLKELKLTNLSICKWASSSAEIFNGSNVFCIPSIKEPFGLIMGEAMMFGLPVISTKTDGACELFGNHPEKKGGIIVNVSSPDELVKAMIKLQNKKFREMISNNARKNITNNFSIDILSSNLKKLLQ